MTSCEFECNLEFTFNKMKRNKGSPDIQISLIISPKTVKGIELKKVQRFQNETEYFDIATLFL